MIPKFYIGNIYPPNEKDSIKISVTKGCSWNKCSFCTSYKNQKHLFRDIDDILDDLNNIRFLLDTRYPIYKDTYFYKQIENWDGNIFIGDSDTIVHPHIVPALSMVNTFIPEAKRYSTYASVSNLIDASPKSYKVIDRIYSGFETGSDKVLKLMNKGHSEYHIKKAYEKCSGKDLHLHLILGLGGKDLSYDHVTKSLEVLNKVLPDCVEFRTIQVEPGSKLEKLEKSGVWKRPDLSDINQELEFFKENLDKSILLDYML